MITALRWLTEREVEAFVSAVERHRQVKIEAEGEPDPEDFTPTRPERQTYRCPYCTSRILNMPHVIAIHVAECERLFIR